MTHQTPLNFNNVLSPAPSTPSHNYPSRILSVGLWLYLKMSRLVHDD